MNLSLTSYLDYEETVAIFCGHTLQYNMNNIVNFSFCRAYQVASHLSVRHHHMQT